VMQHVCSGHVDLAVEENPKRTIAVTLADQRLASFNPDFVEMSGEIDKLRTRNRREERQLSQLASPRTLPPDQPMQGADHLLSPGSILEGMWP